MQRNICSVALCFIIQMAYNRNIIVGLTSRLYADEISALQERIGSVVCLKHYNQMQNINSVGLTDVIKPGSAVDWIAAFRYLNRCTLAILEEVTPDSLHLTGMDMAQNYQIKNTTVPYIPWSDHDDLTVIPPIFGLSNSTVKLESNDYELIFPAVVPCGLAKMAIQKILMYNMYVRLLGDQQNIANINAVEHYTGTVSYLGRTYALNLMYNNDTEAMSVLDDVVVTSSMLSVLLPKVCTRIGMAIIRDGQHPLIDIFAGDLGRPEDNEELNIEEDIARTGLFMSYVHNLSSIFNLGIQLHLSSYSQETKTATCWL